MGVDPAIKNQRRKAQEPRYLSGWKDIANYLGRGVRTVQRYESQLGLPVRRPAGKPRAAVLATKKEIDAWVAASPIRRSFQLVRPATGLPDVNARAIQESLAQMGELRRQMLELRAEMAMSMKLFRKSVDQLHEGLVTEPWWRAIRRLPEEQPSRSRDEHNDVS